VGLLLRREVESGARVSVQVLAPGGWFSRPLAARVVHAKPREGVGWLAGCLWDFPLGEDELRALV
jgi:hypothetical protein